MRSRHTGGQGRGHRRIHGVAAARQYFPAHLGGGGFTHASAESGAGKGQQFATGYTTRHASRLGAREEGINVSGIETKCHPPETPG
jgi:hypothetical protein